MANALGIGVIGCGNISPAYFKGMALFENVQPVACADLDHERAGATAAEQGIRAATVEDLLAIDDVDIVLNLTIPAAHVEVNLAALRAGKHAYCEKPFALSNDDVASVLAEASDRGLRVGCAPDTFLGGGAQTARKLIADGAIGEPVAATAFFTCPGHERWHPAPEFYYKPGGGPMLDMGPYYVTGLVNLLGPVRAVSGSARVSRPTRTITSEPLNGKEIKVEVPTHVAGTLEFACGAIGTIITSFDVWRADLPRIQVHGVDGSLDVPDPNHFKGPVRRFARGHEQWSDVELTHSDALLRGAGVADMATAILSDRPHRASGELAAHVLEVMLAFEQSANQGRRIEMTTTCDQPAPLPAGLAVGALD
jgi:predicted dehydrogenase